MKYFKVYISFLLLLITTFSSGQAIDNLSSCRNISSDKYFRLHYENDFFTATDYYYTQGVNFEFVHPSIKKFPFAKILLHQRNTISKYGLCLEQDCYTPTSIRHNEIIFGDRPFAACLFLKTFLIATDSSQQFRFASALDVGVVGPSAGGEWMQKTIHRSLKNIEPLGWEHQVQNDFILNYEFSSEKNILAEKNFISVNEIMFIHVGTLNDRSGAGFEVMIGKIDSLFQHSNIENKKLKQNFHFHFYIQPEIDFVAYDATLQGGMFNRKNPYAISSNEISRITFQNNFGIVLSFKKIYLEYFQSFLTKEFHSGKSHSWGGVRMGIEL